MFEMFLIGAFAAIIWAMACNNRTYHDRKQLIDEAGAKAVEMISQGNFDDWRDLYKSYNAVSYNQHLWYCFTFRNPMRLYK